MYRITSFCFDGANSDQRFIAVEFETNALAISLGIAGILSIVSGSSPIAIEPPTLEEVHLSI